MEEGQEEARRLAWGVWWPFSLLVLPSSTTATASSTCSSPDLWVVTAVAAATLLLFGLVASLAKLVWDIFHPTIINYPWPSPSSSREDSEQRKKKRDKEITVVLAGSYNPPHRGHLAMLSYLSKR